MNLSHFDDEELLERVIACGEEIPGFCTSFCYSLQDAIDEYGELTEAQRSALENIAFKWNMF